MPRETITAFLVPEDNRSQKDSLIEAYHLLREFAAQHPEGAEILSAID